MTERGEGATSGIMDRIRGRTKRKQTKGLELAINASNRQILSKITESSASDVWKQILKEWGLQETYLGKLQCSRVYFGNEFCQLLMPSPNELAKIVPILEEQELQFTLFTPYVTDLGLNILTPLLDFLDKRAQVLGKKYEIVVNDWGVLRILKSAYHNLTPVLGRLMLKMTKDPRVSFESSESFPGQLRVLRQCSLTLPIYREFLRGYNVERVELDFLEQGIDMDFSQWDIDASFHFPINYVTTSRNCPMACLGREPEYKFKFYNIKCNRECQKYETRLVGQFGETLFYQGNTIFSIPPTYRTRPLQDLANIGITRIIFASEVPM